MAESLLGFALVEPIADRSAMLHGGVEALMTRGGVGLSASDRRAREQHMDRLRELLGEAGFTASYCRGAAMSPPEIVELALVDAG
jgi:hypothetical protein